MVGCASMPRLLNSAATLLAFIAVVCQSSQVNADSVCAASSDGGADAQDRIRALEREVHELRGLLQNLTASPPAGGEGGRAKGAAAAANLHVAPTMEQLPQPQQQLLGGQETGLDVVAWLQLFFTSMLWEAPVLLGILSVFYIAGGDIRLPLKGNKASAGKSPYPRPRRVAPSSGGRRARPHNESAFSSILGDGEEGQAFARRRPGQGEVVDAFSTQSSARSTPLTSPWPSPGFPQTRAKLESPSPPSPPRVFRPTDVEEKDPATPPSPASEWPQGSRLPVEPVPAPAVAAPIAEDTDPLGVAVAPPPPAQAEGSSGAAQPATAASMMAKGIATVSIKVAVCARGVLEVLWRLLAALGRAVFWVACRLMAKWTTASPADDDDDLDSAVRQSPAAKEGTQRKGRAAGKKDKKKAIPAKGAR